MMHAIRRVPRVLSCFKTGYAYINIGTRQMRLSGMTGDKVTVHRAVALTWVPNPHNLPETAHKDGNKLNNWASNLTWKSATGNKLDNITLGESAGAPTFRNPRNRKTITHVSTLPDIFDPNYDTVKIQWHSPKTRGPTPHPTEHTATTQIS